jgi:hypothetical protein
MNLNRSFRPARWLVSFLALAPGFIASPPGAFGQAPVGSWDLVFNGRQRGVAQVTFHANGTLDGLAVFTVSGNKLSHTNAAFVYQHIFGAADVQGGWVSNGPARISGYLNLVAVNDEETITNGFSFRGTARSTRLNLQAHGPAGRINLRGLPLLETNVVELDAVGHIGEARVRRVPFPFIEIFTPTAAQPNYFTVLGNGPGYSFDGILLVSRQRFAALYQNRSADVVGPNVAAYAGPYNPARRRGVLKGTDGLNTGIRYRFDPVAP